MLESGSYIELWNLPGGKTRERRTPAEEILSLSSVDTKLGRLPAYRLTNVSYPTTSILLRSHNIRVR